LSCFVLPCDYLVFYISSSIMFSYPASSCLALWLFCLALSRLRSLSLSLSLPFSSSLMSTPFGTGLEAEKL
jgi:hypothetical protein